MEQGELSNFVILNTTYYHKIVQLFFRSSIILLFISLGSIRTPVFAQEAFFEFDTPPSTSTFVFMLQDPIKIQQARDSLGKKSIPMHVSGTVVKQQVWYNPEWHFHIDPASVNFFENAVEVCDSSMEYLETHLEDACGSFLPQCGWCPWTSRIIREVFPYVTIADYLSWSNYYTTYNGGVPFGDFDANGFIDGRDYIEWLEHYNY